MANNIAINTYIGHATDEDIRFHASSGGITTAAIKYLFESGSVQTGLAFTFDVSSCRFVPKLINSFCEYELCGSIYQDIDLITYIKENIAKIKGAFLITCAPCQVRPIRSVLKRNNIESFIISYVCSGQTTIEGIYKYYELLKIKREDVVGMRYRGKGWPSGIEITKKNGEIIKHPNYTEPWKTLHQSHFYRPRRCFFCQQVYSADADFAVADPWLKEYIEADNIGHTIFVVGTDYGALVLKEMMKTGVVNAEDISYDKFVLSQKPSFYNKSRANDNRDIIQTEYNLISNNIYRKLFTNNLRMMVIHGKILLWNKRIYSIKHQSITTTIMKTTNKLLSKVKRGGVSWYWRNKLGKMGQGWNKGKNVILQNPQCLYFDNNIGIGDNTFFGPVTNYAGIKYDPVIHIGEGTWIGKNCSLAAINKVEIGKHVLFAGHVHITDHSHGYEDINRPVSPQPLISKGPVIIEDDCWLGFSCEILSGVHIGKHCVVAARSVVTKDVPAYSIVAGNPARIVKQYSFETNKWEKVNR